MGNVKYQIRDEHKLRFYSQDLINNLFKYPYTKIDFVKNDLNISRLTASRYLEKLVGVGILSKHTLGRSNYYVNKELFELLASIPEIPEEGGNLPLA